MARDVSWVATGNLHLTVKFLGEVAEGRIEAIVAGITGAVEGVSAFDADVEGLGAFPSAARPRVVWAGVAAGSGTMSDLAGRVDDALAALGFAREARPFSPHITLGRVRQPGRAPALTEALRGAAERPFGRFRVARASLMRSELSPRGARYTELAAVSLGGAVGGGVQMSGH
jgi:RNA 2',3'-cyclic 3'-phosphodiesterase